MKPRLALAAALLAATPAWGQAPPVVDHAWARATSPGANAAAAYLVVHGAAADQLTGFSTPAAASATLHRSAMAGGVMQMRPVDALPVRPGQDLALAPGGYHVMLEGLRQPLKPGDHFPLTLAFAHAGAVTTIVTVERAGAQGPAMQGTDMPMPAHP